MKEILLTSSVLILALLLLRLLFRKTISRQVQYALWGLVALRQLGESERIPYGQTLLRLIPVAGRPESPMLSATTMTAGKRELKDRVTRIAENRRTVGVALLAVVTAAALVCALTFTGAKPSVRSLTGEELSGYALAFNTADRWQDSAGNDCTLRPVQFLTSVYDDPMKIDMYHLFYNGVSPEQPISAAEPEGDAITAPMVGTFYAASAPEQPPFVKVGDRVRKGQPVCLLEAMKMMSEIPAPCDCEITAVLKENGALVSFGEPLFRYQPC